MIFVKSVYQQNSFKRYGSVNFFLNMKKYVKKT